MQEARYLTISEFTSRLKGFFDASHAFQNMYLKGEISNFKKHSSGHLYFSIKDEGSVINAMMWDRDAKKLNFEPVEGTKVLVHGRVTVYEARGTYQIYVDEMQEDGVGNLYAMYEKLKKDLEKEGLFKEEHKKPIPKYPKRVGVITAPTGAAIRDIISTIKRRYPICEILLFPSLVQGDGAASNIVNNIKKAEDYDLDVLIVGRGGGSIEDLWAFNEEVVARAIYASNIPIISAVGHETDFTIADFVADKRAATPTGAAEIAVPSINDILNNLKQLNIRLNEAIIKRVKYSRLILDKYKKSYIITNPEIIYENKKVQLDQAKEKLNMLIKHKLEIAKKEYLNLIDKLELLNPLNTLKRGYSITYYNDKTLTSVKKVKVNDKVSIRLSDGSIKATINEVK